MTTNSLIARVVCQARRGSAKSYDCSDAAQKYAKMQGNDVKHKIISSSEAASPSRVGVQGKGGVYLVTIK